MPQVLVVEDTEANRYVYTSWLRRGGFGVLEAATGGEALRLVGPDIDVVVLDVHLPDMTGFDVCAAIKAQPSTSAVMVMHLSATAIDVASRTRGLNQGADAYLTEPVDPDEFLAAVRALARARQVRRAADELIDRLSRLASVTLPLNRADSIPHLLEAAAAGAADIFGAAALAIVENQDGGAAGVVAGGQPPGPLADALGELVPAAWKAGPGPVPAAELTDGMRRLLSRAGVTAPAWYVTPFVDRASAAAGGLAIALPSAAAQPTAGDVALMNQLTDAMSVALANLHAFAEEHRIALTLQRAMLPDRLPAVPGLSFAARYIAASGEVSVGGDFYDAFVLPSGDTAVVIGDVQGHSLRAATVMAELRFSLRAYLIEGHPPARALELLNALLLRSHPDETATVLLLVISSDGSEAEIANAGHLPPVLVTPGAVSVIEEYGPLLGAPEATHRSRRLTLGDDALVVLTTDGLIERRGAPLDRQIAALATELGRLRELAEDQVADALLDRFAGDADDDIALLVVRRRAS